MPPRTIIRDTRGGDRDGPDVVTGEGPDADEAGRADAGERGRNARTEDVIGADERLSDDQKAALIAVYRSMVGQS